jgi:hypothetical protein
MHFETTTSTITTVRLLTAQMRLMALKRAVFARPKMSENSGCRWLTYWAAAGVLSVRRRELWRLANEVRCGWGLSGSRWLALAGSDWGAGLCGLEQSWSTLVIAVRSAEFLPIGDHWRSRLAALWLAIAGEVGLLFSCRKCGSNCNCSTKWPHFYTFATSCR